MGLIVPAIAEGASLGELEGAAEAIREAIARLVAEGAGGGEPSRCPRCGCERFVRKGRDAGGAQRYLCRGCGRTFTARTMGLLAGSKLPAAKWQAFAACMAAAMTLRETAARVGVCLATAWFMRQRVCEALSRDLERFRTGPGTEAQVDGTLVAESFSGRHGPAFEMPRPPRRRGHQSPTRGVSRERLSVVCGVNDRGQAFLEVAGRGRCTGAQVAGALAGRVEPGTLVATDRHAAYGRVLPAMGAAHEAFGAGTPEASRRLAMVNPLHSRLKAFLARFRGVSSRRLANYLAWFAWREQTRVGAADADRFLFGRECEGVYSTTRRRAWESPFPFMEYWGMSGVV